MFSWPAILAPTKAKSPSFLHCPQNPSESPHTRISFRIVSNNARNPNRNLCAFCLFFVAHFKTFLYAVFFGIFGIYFRKLLSAAHWPHNHTNTHTHQHTLWYNYIHVFNTNLPWSFSLCSFTKTPAEFSCFSCSYSTRLYQQNNSSTKHAKQDVFYLSTSALKTSCLMNYEILWRQSRLHTL